MSNERAQLFRRFDELGIEASTVSYPSHRTVEEGKALRGEMRGTFTKNLLLKDKRGRLFLIVAHEDRELDLKSLHSRIGASRSLRFAPAQEKGGKAKQFHVLRDFLSLGRGDRTYQEVGNELGISESGVKVAVHRLRKRYRELLLEEISGTLEPGESAEAELRYLFGVFQS